MALCSEDNCKNNDSDEKSEYSVADIAEHVPDRERKDISEQGGELFIVGEECDDHRRGNYCADKTYDNKDHRLSDLSKYGLSLSYEKGREYIPDRKYGYDYERLDEMSLAVLAEQRAAVKTVCGFEPLVAALSR